MLVELTFSQLRNRSLKIWSSNAHGDIQVKLGQSQEVSVVESGAWYLTLQGAYFLGVRHYERRVPHDSHSLYIGGPPSAWAPVSFLGKFASIRHASYPRCWSKAFVKEQIICPSLPCRHQTLYFLHGKNCHSMSSSIDQICIWHFMSDILLDLIKEL